MCWHNTECRTESAAASGAKLRAEVQVFKNKAFTRFADKGAIGDVTCVGRQCHQAANRAFWQGKSAGFRALIVFRKGSPAFFVHGFAKNEKDNIEKEELMVLKKLAAALLAYDDVTLTRLTETGALVEVTCDEKTIS